MVHFKTNQLHIKYILYVYFLPRAPAKLTNHHRSHFDFSTPERFNLHRWFVLPNPADIATYRTPTSLANLHRRSIPFDPTITMQYRALSSTIDIRSRGSNKSGFPMLCVTSVG